MHRLHTLYLGGGTPSLLGPDRLERMLELFRPSLTPHAEVTVETNPEDVDAAYAAWTAVSGVRVSLGVQSFSPDLRAVLGRTAQADPAEAFRRLRRAGVANAGVDLIHGIPGRSPELLGADIAAVLDLRPDHVSWYELDVIEGTALAARLAGAAAAGAAPGPAAPDRRRALSMPRSFRPPRRSRSIRRHAGRPAGRRARDRLSTHRTRAVACRLRLVRGQQLRPAGAASAPQRGVLARPALSRTRSGRREHRRPRRWTDAADPAAWAEALVAGEPPPRTSETLDTETLARERLLLAARCGVRVPLAEVAAAIDPAVAGGLARAGLVSLHSGTIRVTRKGRHVADEVCVRLFRSPRLRG